MSFRCRDDGSWAKAGSKSNASTRLITADNQPVDEINFQLRKVIIRENNLGSTRINLEGSFAADNLPNAPSSCFCCANLARAGACLSSWSLSSDLGCNTVRPGWNSAGCRQPCHRGRRCFQESSARTTIHRVDRKSTRLNSSHRSLSRMPSSA